MPRQVFTAGEILTAANLNDVSDATVMVFDDSAARTTAIPTPAEGMVTYLKDTNVVEAFTGAAFEAVSQPGILQVVQTLKTDTFSSTSATFEDVTGAAVTITPSSASSKILIMGTFVMGFSPSAGQSGFVRISGGNSGTYVGAAASNRVSALNWGGFNQATLDPAAAPNNNSLAFLDSPATTSAVTYTLQVRRGSGGTVHIGRNGNDVDNENHGRFPTTMIVMEVAV